jgi:putrescine transport system ATP-binding protein
MTAPPPVDSAFIAIRDVSKRFGGVSAVEGVSINIRKGEFFSLLGPSGCGKTTLMRILAGFERPDSGSIVIDGVDMTAIPPHERPVNMMFQSYALFPHLSVWGNIAFGLKQQGLGRKALAARVDEMLGLVQLEGFARRKPDQLSGGQRQRVALARALARGPKVLLLDEPLAALDKKLRKETQAELKRIQALSGATFIVVTHDQEEAMALSDRIAIMRDGRIIQIDAPGVVYDRPANRYVAGFVGDVNLFPATVTDLPDGKMLVAAQGVQGTVTLKAEGLSAGNGYWLAIRPEQMRMAASQTMAADHWMPGRIEDRAHLGAQVAYRVHLAGGERVNALVASNGLEARHLAGTDVVVGFRATDAQLLRD